MQEENTDHIVAMQQSLNFYEAILSHDHPSYTRILRLAFEGTQIQYSKALVRLACVTAMFAPHTIYVGLFSMNIEEPHDHRNPDNNSLAPFFGVVAGVLTLMCFLSYIIYMMFKTTKHKYAKRGKLTDR
jgi:Mg2+ and Co2+ transporter CorA